MSVQEGTGRQFACKMINLKARAHGSDDEEEYQDQGSKFFNSGSLKPTKPRKAGLDKMMKDRLERNQREARILANLSHVSSHHQIQCSLSSQDSKSLRSQTSSLSRRPFGQTTQCQFED
jgi:hypothetical protein